MEMQDREARTQKTSVAASRATPYPTVDVGELTDEATLFAIPVGKGHIYYFGYDFDAPHAEWAALLHRVIRS